MDGYERKDEADKRFGAISRTWKQYLYTVLVLAAPANQRTVRTSGDAGKPVRRDRRLPILLGALQRKRDGDLGIRD